MSGLPVFILICLKAFDKSPPHERHCLRVEKCLKDQTKQLSVKKADKLSVLVDIWVANITGDLTDTDNFM